MPVDSGADMADGEDEPVPGWVPRPNTRHERLVWIAAKPRLEKMNRRWWHQVFAMTRSAGIDEHGIHAEAADREEVDKRMQRSAFIVDELAGRFTAEERERLGRTGRLPGWFWPSYDSEVRTLR